MNFLTIIPARSGSKRIKNKNTILCNGKPLIFYAIDACLDAEVESNIVHLSTDSEAIAELGEYYGADVPFLRNELLAKDDTPTMNVVKESLFMYSNKYKEVIDAVILVQCTSPCIEPLDIYYAVELFKNNDMKTVVSFHEINMHPEWFYTEDLKPLMKGSQHRKILSQNLPKYYTLNGMIKVMSIDNIINDTVKPEIPYLVLPSIRGIDIDNMYDLKVAESYLNTKV